MKPMSRILTLAVLLLAGGLTSGAASAEEPPVLQLTLPGAVEMALAGHPAMTLARNRRESAAVSVETARGTFLPDLQGSAGASERYAQQPPPGDGGDSRTLSLDLSSSLNLFNGFADVADLGSARRRLDAAGGELLRQQQTTALNVANAFIAVLTSRELVTVAEESLAREKALLEQVDAFYRAGSRSVTDFYRQQAATAQAELDLLDAGRNLEVAGLLLVQNLGMERPLIVEPLSPDPFALVAVLQGLDAAQTLARAWELRPDLLAGIRRIEGAEEEVRRARAGYLPRLDLTASAGTGYSSLNSGRNLNDQLTRDNGDASVGLFLNVPIFDRFLTRTGVAQARIGQSDAFAEVARLRQQIGVEVGQALADYRRAELQLTVSKAQLDYARQALDAAEARYRVGATNWIDLADTRATFVRARGDEVRARQGLLQQSLAVGYARGDLETLLPLLVPLKEKS
jgi:outer membrane protein